MRLPSFSRCLLSRTAVTAVALSGILSVLPVAGVAYGAEQPIPPQTRIRISVVQWNVANGAYERWDALGGEYEVSARGTVLLPVIGELPVADSDTTALSSAVANALQAKLGLVQPPQATVAIVTYPPVFVVGDVKSPGEYRFSPGLTVLQSLAMSGGEYRESAPASQQAVTLANDLRGFEDSIVRSEIRIARLQAEMAGADKIDYAPSEGVDADAAAAILRQEQAIFLARANHIDRQSKSLNELREFFTREMANLETKTRGSEEDIKSLEEELRKMKPLVEKGLVVPAVRNELQRTIRGIAGDRLDLTTAIMRARQGVAEASRNIEALHDVQMTEVARDLQSEQSVLVQLKLKRQSAQQTLLEALSRGAGESDDVSLHYAVSRWQDGKLVDIVAAESTVLEPGDVVRVERRRSPAADSVDPGKVAGPISQ